MRHMPVFCTTNRSRIYNSVTHHVFA